MGTPYQKLKQYGVDIKTREIDKSKAYELETIPEPIPNLTQIIESLQQRINKANEYMSSLEYAGQTQEHKDLCEKALAELKTDLARKLVYKGREDVKRK